MQDSSTALTTVLQFRQDIQARLRDRVRQAIEETLDEELAATLGSTRHERTAGRHSGLNARAAYDTFVKKWTTLCSPVARSLEEAGLDLLTFCALCGSRCARRTRLRISIANSGAAPRPKRRSGTEAAAVTLLFGLVAFGHIVLRKIDGHQDLPTFLAKEWSQAA